MLPDMPPCENVFDCEAKSLDKLVNLTDLMQEQHHLAQQLNDLQQQIVIQNAEMIKLQQQQLSQSEQHGIGYIIMSELAVIYILWMLRHHLTIRTINRICRGLHRLYQRITMRTSYITLCRSRSQSRVNTPRNVEVELGPITTMSRDSVPDYQSITETVIDMTNSVTPSQTDVEIVEYIPEVQEQTHEERVETSEQNITPVLYVNIESTEREVGPSETASRTGSIFIV